MQRTCAQCNGTFEITPKDQNFLEKISPVFHGKKELIPPPTLCPPCRMQRRLATRNERNLYKRKCDLTGRQIISTYSPDKPYTVYQSDEWYSDAWDGRTYGRDFDFGRTFFEQFLELKKAVPRMALVTTPKAEEYNCQYINFAGDSRNCYMTFDSDFNEDSYYTKVLKHSKRCVDCTFVHHSELCYDCIDCHTCYNLRYSQDCTNCSDSAFLKDCLSCKNCIFCANLVQKEYHIRNKPYYREEYEKIVRDMKLEKTTSVEKLQEEFDAFIQQFPKKFAHQLKAEDSTGDYQQNVQRCHQCYDVGDAQDLTYCDALYKARDCQDVSSFGEGVELLYECATAGIDSYHNLFCFEPILGSSDLLYCDELRASKHCFGCTGLKHASYCIFNKQYSKEEYEKLVPEIIGHMRKTGEYGEFFPIKDSPYTYNETVATEYFALTKEQVLKQGWTWKEEEKTVNSSGATAPDDIKNASDEICSTVLRCNKTGRPYKIIPQELQFYRDLRIPIPQLCPDERHDRRMAKRNPRTLWNRECSECKKKFRTSYAPDRPEIIYCGECYRQNVY